MSIYYCRETKNWVHYSRELRTIGGSKKELLSLTKSASHEGIPFQLLEKDQHVGPLIGIMTSPKSKNSLVGNRRLFIQIQNELLKRDALSFVFSYEDVQEDGWLFGYIYLPSQKDWLRAKIPYPDLVYNRIPFRKSEKSNHYHTCLACFQDNQIPIFNPGFIDKYQLFQILKGNDVIKHFLPDTILIESAYDLKSFFNKHKDLYIKPRNLSKGKNIYRLYKQNNQLVIESKENCTMFMKIENIFEYYKDLFSNKSYLAQCTVKPALTDGKRFDFRILAHWSVSKQKYIVTGVAIRASEPYKLTTHLINGGSIFPYNQIQSKNHDFFIKTIVEEIGTTLTKKVGFFGEFSIDAGLSIDGKYVLYEVNSKPMSFDEKDIEQNRIIKLCDLFLQKLGYRE